MYIKKIRSSRFVRNSLFCLSAILTTLTIGGCAKKEATPTVANESISDIQKREGIPVRTVTARRSNLTMYEFTGGTAEGYFQTTLTAGMPGTITKVNVSIGDNVKADASLMQIDPSSPQNYDLVKQQFDNAAKSRERVAALAREGAVSQEIIDQMDVGYNTAKEGLDIIRKSQFVVAPFGGTVVNIHKNVNNTVSPGAELVTIANIHKVRIPVTVSDLLINKFRKGQTALTIIDGDTLRGTLDKVPLSGNESTHTFNIDVVFDNQNYRIKPGMYVKIQVVVDEKQDIISLPMDAVIIEGVHQSAFVITDGIAHKTTITTGERSADTFEITSGISDGAHVVVSGASLLSEGTKTKIVQ